MKEGVVPSVKPNSVEINALKRKRGLYKHSNNLFSGLFYECRSALKDQKLAPENARCLLNYLVIEKHIASLFPNNLLARLLRSALLPDQWSQKYETLLVRFISKLYVGDPEDHMSRSFTIGVNPDQSVTKKYCNEEKSADELSPPFDNIYYYFKEVLEAGNELFEDVVELIFDDMPTDITIADRFVGFTGPFKASTRKQCFEAVRKRGGCPSAPFPFMDYLFVWNYADDQLPLSTQVLAAIFYRRMYGNPLILKEKNWNQILNT